MGKGKHADKDWITLFGVEPYFAETFVDMDKYRGACYKSRQLALPLARPAVLRKKAKPLSITDTRRLSMRIY